MPVQIRGTKRSKYGAKPTVLDGIRFASRREAARYAELKALQRAGVISDLELQPAFPLVVQGIKVATYRADFRYRNRSGEIVVEDVKGVATPVYRLKAKLMLALHKIAVSEVR